MSSKMNSLSDEVFQELKKTSHKPSYDNLLFDRENVWDPFVNLEKSSHKPKYNEKVTGIDHKGEIIFFEPTKIEKKK